MMRSMQQWTSVAASNGVGSLARRCSPQEKSLRHSAGNRRMFPLSRAPSGGMNTWMLTLPTKSARPSGGICITGRTPSSWWPMIITFYSLAELRAAIEEARAAGVTVAVHVFGGQAADNVIEARPDSIEHGFDLTDAQLRAMKQKDVVLVGTDFPEEHLEQVHYNPVKEGNTLGQRIVDRLRRAHQVGVRMAFGTDVFFEVPDRSRAELMFDYLDIWTSAGIRAPDILRAMTTNAAELFRWKGVRGSIAPGQAADIIATAESPLADIAALRKVHFVMKDGRLVKR